MINHIVQLESRNKVTYQVYYDSGRRICYGTNDDLPLSVLNFLLNSEVTTEYHSASEFHPAVKITRYHK